MFFTDFQAFPLRAAKRILRRKINTIIIPNQLNKGMPGNAAACGAQA